MRKLFRRVAYLLNRRRLEQELAEEMAAHREMMEAGRARAFGNPSAIQEEVRDIWGWQWLDQLRQDVRYAVRGFVRERRISVSAVVAIALAVGAATAVFSVVDRSLFRPLPYRDGDRLVTVGLVLPSWGPAEVMFAGAYRDWQPAQNAVDLTSWKGVSACDLAAPEAPRILHCAFVESTFLPVLGVEPALGRGFTADDDRPGADPVVLLSHGFWMASFGGDARALDRRIPLDGKAARIIGVLPPGFELPDLAPADVVLPQQLPRERMRNVEFNVIGRMRHGVTVQSATAALEPLFEAFRKEFGKRVGDNFARTMRYRVRSLRDVQVEKYRAALWMLLAAVAAFVLIACANVGNLLLARTSMRRHEFQIRAAIGASKSRLVRQMLTESAMLAIAGGIAGCGLAWLLLRMAIHLAPEGVLRLSAAVLDSRVLGFAVLLSAGTAVVCGLAPATQKRIAGRRQNRGRQALIVAQLSVSLVLLSAAGLLLMSLQRLLNVPLGLQRERVITATFTLPEHRYTNDAKQLAFFTDLERRLEDLPGATASAITDSLPPSGETRRAPVSNEDKSAIIGNVRWRYVTPGYFEALGIPIRLGRAFNDEDRDASDLAVVVSESFWRSPAGREQPMGRPMGARWPRVTVGVAGDVRNSGLASSAEPEFYVVRRRTRAGVPGADPAWWRRATAIVRTTQDEGSAAESLRAAFRAIDPALPVSISTMNTHVDRLLTRPRFQTVLLALIAFGGLILAAIGLYGVVAYLVSERTREIGVRIALGATPHDVVRMVVSGAGRWTAVGATLGIAASAVSLRWLQSVLFDVNPYDVRALSGATVVLVAVSLLAAWIPARRAVRIDPVAALRQE